MQCSEPGFASAASDVAVSIVQEEEIAIDDGCLNERNQLQETAGGPILVNTCNGTPVKLCRVAHHKCCTEPEQHKILIQELSRRVGSVPGGSPIPGIVREQRWSPLDVPLMWAAAGQEPATPVLDWLIPTLAKFSRDQFQRRIGRSGRSSDDWVDFGAHSNAQRG